jgi:hypothetical protein
LRLGSDGLIDGGDLLLLHVTRQNAFAFVDAVALAESEGLEIGRF